MVAKHTPGPWHIEHGYRQIINGITYWQVTDGQDAICCNQFCYAGNSEANALLIASAPELLDALKKVTSALVATTSLIIRAEDEKTRPSKVAASDKMFLQMLTDYDHATATSRAAIAKAEGRNV